MSKCLDHSDEHMVSHMGSSSAYTNQVLLTVQHFINVATLKQLKINCVTSGGINSNKDMCCLVIIEEDDKKK